MEPQEKYPALHARRPKPYPCCCHEALVGHGHPEFHSRRGVEPPSPTSAARRLPTPHDVQRRPIGLGLSYLAGTYKRHTGR
jgi:hypothetical protein